MTRVQALFLTALTGLFAVVVTLAYELLGGAVATGVGVALVAVVLVSAARARAAQQERRREAGSTCSCCTSTHFDPVKVV